MEDAIEMAAVISKAGGPSRLGAVVGRSHSTVLGWDRVPAQHARAVSEATGYPLHVLRPDVFPGPVDLTPDDPAPVQVTA